MSQFTDYAENKLIDMIRAQAWSLPGSLYLGLASAVADNALTEITGTSYARLTLARSLANWAGTQAAGSTLASSGTSHKTSNNTLLNWGTAGSAWGSATHVGVYDAISAGNAICYLPLVNPINVGIGDPVSLAIGTLGCTLGLTGGCSDYLANKLIDFIFRGQAFTFPATMYSALLTAAPSNAGGGTEVGGGIGYARVSRAGSLANWAGTQSAGSTTASSGSSGLTSNNSAITHGSPTGAWGTIGWTAFYDAASAGNLLFWAALGAAKTVGTGASPPSFAAAALTISFS